jgi:hypothetical protein
MADPVIVTVLAYGHILSAMGWLGGALLTTFVISPKLQAVTAQTRLEFLAKVMPSMVRFVIGMIIGTFLFGLLLLYTLLGGDMSMMAPSTPFGLAISTGVALAVVAGIVGFAVSVPSFRKIISIADGMLKSGQTPPPPELAKYSKRARAGSLAVAVLLLLTLVMMVAAGFY